MLTMVQYTDTLSGSTHDIRMSLNHQFVKGCIMFMMPATLSGSVTDDCNYQDKGLNSALFSATRDRLAI